MWKQSEAKTYKFMVKNKPDIEIGKVSSEEK